MKSSPAVFGLALLLAAQAGAQTPVAIMRDPPMDAAHPAGMEVVHIPSQGAVMIGVLYRAAGAGPHPTAILLHGLPGAEQNLDVAQAMRRAGWNVLTFHFRGSWGSPGAFSFTHELEDTQAALDFVRTPAIAAKYGVDAKAIILVGHSVGGLAAAIVGARNPDVRGVATISAVDLGGFAAQGKEAVAGFMSGNMDGLTGTSPTQLADEIVANREAWTLAGQARALANRPLLVVTADDGLADASLALGQTVKAQGGSVTEVHLAGDHAYSGQRIALEAAVVTWLKSLHAGKLASTS